MSNRLYVGDKIQWTFLLLLSLIFTAFPWLSPRTDGDPVMGLFLFGFGLSVFSSSTPLFFKVFGIVCSGVVPFALCSIWLPKRDTFAAMLARCCSTLLFCVCYIGCAVISSLPYERWAKHFPAFWNSNPFAFAFYLAIFASLSLAVYHIISWKRRQT